MRTATDARDRGDEQTANGRPSSGGYTAGTVLSGKYRLEGPLGEGGMGVVWRASNVLLDLPVAIKLIRADLDDGSLRARLQLEARAAAKLGHSSIVRVFDVGESEFGDPFIVMEHLRGETLAQLIGRARVPATRAVQLLLPIIDALAAAHARGIVHRDLKPDNVMIAFDEQRVCPKILDFGIAKLIDPCDANFKLTEIGAVVGSPEYMSPEQARGREDIDSRTDVWSTCVVLYEAVTGQPPFSASNCNALLRRIVEDAPAPLSEHGVGDAALWQILERGLRKDRAQRYPKISELGQALAGWLLAQGVFEDACGSTLDSKWLGRKSEPIELGGPAARQPSWQPPSERPSHLRESNAHSSGLARGPFTKTIQPRPVRRTRTFRALFAAGALFAVLGTLLGRSSQATQIAASSQLVARLATEHASSVEPRVAEHGFAARAAPPPAAENQATATASEQRDPGAKPKVAETRAPKLGASPTRALPQVAPRVTRSSPPLNPAPAASIRPERPLDLMAPY